MKRRSFICAAICSMIPIPSVAYPVRDTENMLRVVESFPKMPFIGSDKLKQLTYFVVNRPNSEIGFSIETQSVLPSREFDLRQIFEEDLTILDYGSSRRMINAIISGGNRVALQCRRGKGNNYCVFDDHVLIWYQSTKTLIDTPVQMIGKNLAYNPNYKDYFVRVKCKDKLTADDIAILAQSGFKKI